ncbi:hypothetical protein PC9H_007143 [Pleurotus ostreatus]|uniref:Uncharacterized protein n=1 Tax=Pleurotus ostreatus TaxID=5322 RepID=A0A8H6ZT09_PLEOS|nr:uncharacterized protein PC9H_007143 [Pleurotus ostreatus]KAF7427926.1 hypothetical protein PC9H_007143 [Pleurotus ostreatus]
MQTKSILAIAAYVSVVFALATPVIQTEQTGEQAEVAVAQRSVDFLPISTGGNRNANGGNGNSGNYNTNKGSGSNGNIGNGGSA